MSGADDDDFAVRPAPPRARRNRRVPTFVARVVRASGGHRPSGRTHRAGAAQGRGQVAARQAGRSLSANARRVVVKVRVVRASTSSPQATATHLRYIERDGVGPNGEAGHAYDAPTDAADLQAFQERGTGDRHQFRVIVAPEDGMALGDLRPFVRQLMRTVERDLGTGMDWIAVDHWNTDNPHSHIVLRGREACGRDLVIAPDYIAHGLRARASELATQWLGARTEREINATLQREVTQERWTRLDQTLQQRQRDGTLRLPRGQAPAAQDALLRGRLQTLTELGLAHATGADAWQFRTDWENTLRRLGERGDIIRTLQRAMGTARRELSILDGTRPGQTIVGRVAGKGLADELTDRGYLAVDGLDGRAHYIALPNGQALEQYPIGAVIEARTGGVRAIDEAIARHSEGGTYRAQQVHDPDHRLAQVRRLEALRRAGLVERLADGVWRIPADLPERGRAFDAQRLGGAVVTLQSPLPVEQQTRAAGATWLDRQLIGKAGAPAAVGFGAQVRDALGAREAYLLEQGLATRRGQRVILARNLLNTLRDRELFEAAQQLHRETGLAYRPIIDGARIQGTYRRAVQLVSGRYALIDDGSGFSLVPWRPVADKYLGQPLSVTVLGQRTSWDFGPQRRLSR